MKRAAILVFLVAGCSKDPIREGAPKATATPSATSNATLPPAPAPAPAEAPDASYLAPVAADAGLNPREQGALAVALTDLDAPCASMPITVAECLQQGRDCAACGDAARYVAIGLHSGWPPQFVRLAYDARFDPNEAHDLPVDGSPTKGPADAPVTIVEFGSYLCPHCAAEAPKLDALLRAHPKDVRLVMKPAWSPSNPVSERVTRYAHAAAAQGRFWEMHALLFANQPKFDDASIDGYARSLKMDAGKLHVDAQSDAVTTRLMKDRAAAQAAKVDSLPSIWINGHPFLYFEDLEARVAYEIDAARRSAAADAGTTRK
jgi:protein-disulfide isomerase